MQHDCLTNGKCTNMNTVYEVQEREQTTRLQYRLKHSDATHFVLNLHGLHNAKQIRLALPSNLYTRCPQNFDRQEIFESAVEKMKQMKEGKDQVAAAKRGARAIVTEALKATTVSPVSEPGSQSASLQPKRNATGKTPAEVQRAKRPRCVNSSNYLSKTFTWSFE